MARLVVFAAMAAMLVVALAIPEAFGADALLFALAFAVVRAAQIGLYAYGSADVSMRTAVVQLGGSTGLACSLLIAASAFDGTVQGLFWLAALAVDFGGPLVIDVGRWRVSPGHFAERHGLIVTSRSEGRSSRSGWGRPASR